MSKVQSQGRLSRCRSGESLSGRINQAKQEINWTCTFQVDGSVVIFDLETNGVARKLRGHTRQIQSLRYGGSQLWLSLVSLTVCSWSRDGRYLLSASQDWKCILWDLKDGSRVRMVRFAAPVYIAELHPFNQ